MVVTFIGHRKLQADGNFHARLKELVLSLVDDRGADVFLFGSKSEFDDLCLEVVSEIKKERPYIKRIYVRAEYPFIDKDYEDYLLGIYDATYIPENVVEAGKAAYVERNRHMIDRADLCVFCYDENYKPPLACGARGRVVCALPKSGTKAAYEYAVKREKEIVNVFGRS